jgi:hypothetical protein
MSISKPISSSLPITISIISYFFDSVNKKIKLFFLNIWKVGTIIAESQFCAKIPKFQHIKKIKKTKITFDKKEKIE